MSYMEIVFPIISAVIGAVIVFVIMSFIQKKRKQNLNVSCNDSENNKKQNMLEKQLSEIVVQKSQLEAELSQSKQLLAETQQQIKSLLENSDNSELVFGFEQNIKLQEDIDEQNKCIEELNNKIIQYENRINQLNFEILTWQQEKEKIEEDLKNAINKEMTQRAQIKELEDENEELEEEKEELENKIKKKQQENIELEEQLHKEKRQIATLTEDIGRTKEELSSAQNDLLSKEESLSFVQDVLQAKKASDGRELEAIVDRIKDFILNDVCNTLETLSKDNVIGWRVDENLKANVEKWAIQAKRTWIKNKTTIAFVGEFSAGKTSIVNRILSQDNPNIPLLPVSMKPTTAIPTYISGGKATSYQLYSPDNQLKIISESTFKKVSKEVLDQVEGVSSLITYFVMKYKNPNLEKLSILDTPGFSSTDQEDAIRTIEVINQCDALFWVFDANAGTINRSSIDIIKKHLKKPLYIVINKADTKSNNELSDLEKLISQTLSKNGIIVKEYIRFSRDKKFSLDLLMRPIAQIVHDASLDSLLEDILQHLKDIEQKLENRCQDAQRACDSATNEQNKVVKKFEKTLSALSKRCATAAEIPHYSSGFLGLGSGYKMSEDQYNNLINLLEKIAYDDYNNLVDSFNSNNSAVAEIETAYQDLMRATETFTQISELNNEFEKLVKKYIKL